jgi:hypothetical protein
LTVYNVLTQSLPLKKRFFNRLKRLWCSFRYGVSKVLFVIKRKQNIYTLMTNLSDSLSAGFDFITAVRFATQYSNYYYVRQVGLEMIDRSHSGEDVANIFSHFPALFSSDFLSLLLQFKNTSLQGLLKYYIELQELSFEMRKSLLLTLTPVIISVPAFIIICILFNQAVFVPLQKGFDYIGLTATSLTQLFISVFTFQKMGFVLLTFFTLVVMALMLRVSGKLKTIRGIIDYLLIRLPWFRQREFMLASLSFVSGLSLSDKLQLSTPINFSVAQYFVRNLFLKKRVGLAIDYLKIYGIEGIERYLTAFLPVKDAYVLLLGLRLNNLADVCERLSHFRLTQIRFIQKITAQIIRYTFVILLVLLFLWLLVTTLELGTRAINAYQFILNA